MLNSWFKQGTSLWEQVNCEMKPALGMKHSQKLLAMVPERLGCSSTSLTSWEKSSCSLGYGQDVATQRHGQSPAPLWWQLGSLLPCAAAESCGPIQGGRGGIAVNSHPDFIRTVSVSEGFCHSSSIFVEAGIFFLFPKELAFHTSLFNQETDKVGSPYIVLASPLLMTPEGWICFWGRAEYSLNSDVNSCVWECVLVGLDPQILSNCSRSY